MRRATWQPCLVFLILAIGCGKRDSATSSHQQPNAPPDPLAEAKALTRANLTHIAEAFERYEKAKGFYPIGLCDSKTSKLFCLSWRVQILPYLADPAAAALYRRFHLDEPWDSEHNAKLVKDMPKVFADPTSNTAEGMTFYQGFADHQLGPKGEELHQRPFLTGYGAAFFPDPRSFVGIERDAPVDADGARPVNVRKMMNIVDGTANTVLLAEAGEAVPWSKPQDIPFRYSPPKKGTFTGSDGRWPELGKPFGGDFHVVTVSGDIHLIRKGAPVDKLRTFITFADGELPDFPALGLEEPEWLREMKAKEAKRK